MCNCDRCTKDRMAQSILDQIAYKPVEAGSTRILQDLNNDQLRQVLAFIRSFY